MSYLTFDKKKQARSRRNDSEHMWRLSDTFFRRHADRMHRYVATTHEMISSQKEQGTKYSHSKRRVAETALWLDTQSSSILLSQLSASGRGQGGGKKTLANLGFCLFVCLSGRPPDFWYTFSSIVSLLLSSPLSLFQIVFQLTRQRRSDRNQNRTDPDSEVRCTTRTNSKSLLRWSP